MKKMLVFQAETDGVRLRQRKGGRTVDLHVEESVFVAWQQEYAREQLALRQRAAVATGGQVCEKTEVHAPHWTGPSMELFCPGWTNEMQRVLDAGAAGEKRERFVASLIKEK